MSSDILRLFKQNAGKPLTVVGSANVDHVITLQRLPKVGETIPSKQYQILPGGKGANQAVAAAKAGYQTQFIGQVGNDGGGRMLLDNMRQAGVDVGHVKTVDQPSGSAFVLLQDGGDNSIILHSGANNIDRPITEQEQQVISQSGAILLQREIPETFNRQVVQVAHDNGVPVVLDCGGSLDKIDDSLMKQITILSPNSTELQNLTGIKDLSESQQIENAAVRLLESGVGAVVVKLGEHGSMHVQENEVRTQPAVPVKAVVDTTGAGDCYTAWLAVGLLQHSTMQTAMYDASVAASICIQRMGATPSMPSMADVKQASKQ